MKTALLLALAMATPASWAQDDRDSSRQGARDFDSEVVREIQRGMFVKAGAGSTQYIGNFNGILRPVVALNIGIGQDFVDREKLSVSWEAVFNQALHNGPKFEELGSLPPPVEVQGDIHTFAGMAMFEASGYLTRRFGIGIRAGGGVMVVPVLMELVNYQEDVEGGAWNGVPATVHAGPLPLVGGGPTIEYYTKLSHFSVGLDADVMYAIGMDLGITPSGYFKYTF